MTTPVMLGTAPLLRVEAETRLSQGTAPFARDATLSVNTLELLHELARSPSSAADALKLLHELQVHQVELDLQIEQQELNELELSCELARYRNLFEFAPIGYLVLTLDGHIIEANQTAPGLLGVVSDELAGRRFDCFLAAASQSSFAGLLNNLSQDGSSTSCQMQTDAIRGLAGTLELSARVSPGGDAVLLIVSRQD